MLINLDIYGNVNGIGVKLDGNIVVRVTNGNCCGVGCTSEDISCLCMMASDPMTYIDQYGCIWIDVNGTVDYLSNGKIYRIGGTYFDYLSNGRIYKIGSTCFDYFSDGRVYKIGYADVGYLSNGRIYTAAGTGFA